MPLSETILIALKLAGAAEFKREASQAADSVKHVGDESKKADAPVSKFSDRLKSMGGAGRTGFGGLAKWAAGAGAVYATTKGLKDAVHTTEDLAKNTMAISRTTGIDTKQSSLWAEVMRTRGISTQQQQMGLKGLGRAMDNASKGGKKQIAMFKELGISQADIAKGDVNQVLMKTADAFQKNLTPIQRTAVAQQLFGRTGMSLVPVLSKGSAGIQELMDTAEKYGAVIKDTKAAQEQAARMREMKVASDGLKISLGTALLPTIEAVTQIILQVVQVVQPLLRSGTALKTVILALAYALAFLKINALLAAAGFTTMNASILLIPLAIAAVIAVVVILYNKWGWFHRAVDNTWKFIKRNWPLLLAVLIGPFAIAVVLIIRNFNKIKAGVQIVIRAVRQIPGAVGSAFRSAVAKGRELIAGFKRFGKGIVDGIVSGIKSAPGAILDAIKSILPGGKVGSAVKKFFGFQHGGTVMPGQGMQVVGERGPEIASFRAGTKIIPLTNASLPRLVPAAPVGGGGQVVVPVYLNGREIARAIGQDTADQRARRGH